MKIPEELRWIRKRRCTKCVCPIKNHKENVANGFWWDMAWWAFYDEEWNPDGWACWMNPERTCKGCDAVLRELITNKLWQN
jgi:hypothetical protein